MPVVFQPKAIVVAVWSPIVDFPAAPRSVRVLIESAPIGILAIRSSL
jgi:hypothetical protein